MQIQKYGRPKEPYFCTYFQGGFLAPDVVAVLGGSTFNHQPKHSYRKYLIYFILHEI